MSAVGPVAGMGAGPELMELRVGPVAAGGACVARGPDGRVVFVRHALPDELVVVSVTQRTSSFLRADTVEVLEASPDRVKPPCPYAGPGRCGGCDWQHVALARQRSLKAELVSEQLRHLAGLDEPVVVEEVIGAPGGLGWRTRVQFSVDRSGRTGFHRHRSRRLELVDSCLIASAAVEAVGVEKKRWVGAAKVEVSTGLGETPALSETAALVVVEPDRQRLRALPALDAEVMVQGRTTGPAFRLRHRVRDKVFEVGPGAFWQVHPAAAATLVGAVLGALGPRAGDRVLDLYAGSGLFSVFLAEAVGPEGSVLAVESDRQAALDAAGNGAGFTNLEVITAKVDTAVLGAAGRCDLIVLDPPRAGAGLEVSAALARTKARALVYVACEPSSFARDLRVFRDGGWTLRSLRAFDLFPMTEHVELVALLHPPGPARRSSWA